MVSPQLQNTGLPTIYRLSVSRYVDNPQHYSISLHAVVGGCVDGFLFLGRFDNNNECNHIVKPDKAVLKNDIQFTLTAGNSMTNQHFHEIGFPHIHLADANYACGSIPEKVTPKFVEKCKNNNFEENIEYIMHLFGISHYHNFYKQDEKLLTLIQKGKVDTFGALTDDPNRRWLSDADLFKEGDTFTFSEYSHFLSKTGVKKTTMDNGETFPYTIHFDKMSQDQVTVTVSKTK